MFEQIYFLGRYLPIPRVLQLKFQAEGRTSVANSIQDLPSRRAKIKQSLETKSKKVLFWPHFQLFPAKYPVTCFSGRLLTIKGGRTANKFRKSRIRKFVDLYNLLDLRAFLKCGTLRICDLQTQSFIVICRFVICKIAICGPKLFADIKLLQVRKYILFLLTNKAYSTLIQICTK